MATVAFDIGGTTYKADVPESFFSLSEEEQRKRLMGAMGRQEESAAPAQPTVPI